MAKFEYMERAFSSELRPRARLVLQVLVLHCNKEGECFPSIKTIAAKCGYGISTVKRALDELVEAGYIIKQDVYKRQVCIVCTAFIWSMSRIGFSSWRKPIPSLSLIHI